MNTDTIHAAAANLLTRAISDPASIENSPDCLSCFSLEQYSEIKKLQAFIIKVKHTAIRRELPCTFRLLGQAQLELPFFCAFAPAYLAARRAGLFPTGLIWACCATPSIVFAVARKSPSTTCWPTCSSMKTRCTTNDADSAERLRDGAFQFDGACLLRHSRYDVMEIARHNDAPAQPPVAGERRYLLYQRPGAGATMRIREARSLDRHGAPRGQRHHRSATDGRSPGALRRLRRGRSNDRHCPGRGARARHRPLERGAPAVKMLLVDNLLFEGGLATPRFDRQPHLGLMSLVAVLRGAGADAVIADPKREVASGCMLLDNNLAKSFAARLAAEDADIVGFTALGCNFPFVVRAAIWLKHWRRPSHPARRTARDHSAPPDTATPTLLRRGGAPRSRAHAADGDRCARRQTFLAHGAIDQFSLAWRHASNTSWSK